MRTSVTTGPNGLSVRAVSGTHVVFLAFDCTPACAKGLLGFAVSRYDHADDSVSWLRGLKRFEAGAPTGDGEDVNTRHHPIQKFQWGDYTAKPGRSYTYRVHAVRGQPSAVVRDASVDVTVTCEKPGVLGSGGHAVHFNRSAAASQAFARRFPGLPKGKVDDPNARVWLSNGLEEALLDFIRATKPSEGLHLFIYEFEKEAFASALKDALGRGVRLEILYDAITKKDAKKGTLEGPSIESEPLLKRYGLLPSAKGRAPDGLSISHNKFLVRTDAGGKPAAVWTGSTNLTDSAVYGQSNVGHALNDAGLAKQFFDWHQAIWRDPDLSAAKSRQIVEQLTALPKLPLKKTHLVLSPRSKIEAIDRLAALVKGAKQLICFTAPFALHDALEAALVAAKVPVLGLLNTKVVVQQAVHDAPNVRLAWAGALDEKSVLEAWQGQLLAESMHHRGVYIHSKFMLIDPLSDAPLVVTGSANFSTNSSTNNDENQLFVVGEREVTDVYLGEFMRLFEHYRFRSKGEAAAATEDAAKSRFLDPTDAWAKRWFKAPKAKLRTAFF